MKQVLNIYNLRITISWLMCAVLLNTGCTSLIPEDLDALGDDVTLTLTEFTPYLGRTSVYENVVNVSNKSTLPLTFNVVGVRTFEGAPAPELMEKYPVKVWHQTYTGEEKSVEEIEAKRRIEYRPMLDIQHKNGDIIFWNTGKSSFLKTIPSDGYLFDLEIQNSGGRKYVREVALKPFKERPYEPSQYDPASGLSTTAYLRPSYLNIYGKRTGNIVMDVRAYIFKQTENLNPGNTFTVSVVDSLGQAIDVKKFKDTDFAHLVHGFNPRYQDGKVTYDVVYPMPLINYPTRYTDIGGDRSRILLRYDRIGFGGLLQQAGIWLDLAIFEEGHWELQFRFNGESPNFDNEQ
ncbi:DUF5007 domain-containing protein [Sphingobacterium sp. SGG-5]|nr:DUF5007 domain-containing protein [Sphingobacterium sp. SGG-5]